MQKAGRVLCGNALKITRRSIEFIRIFRVDLRTSGVKNVIFLNGSGATIEAYNIGA